MSEGAQIASRLGLFEGFGIEIELMIVDARTLAPMPICDRLIAAVAGSPESEIERGPIAWSNELTLHVLELKTNGPAEGLSGLAGRFHQGVLEANAVLAAFGARLMPGGMHPWMAPETETRLWPHEYTEVYRTFDRIFGCSGHGWANLQSTHLNLPFADDEEFGRLHAAIRLVLPLVPALAAASPIVDGRIGPALDSRIVAYRTNAERVPSVSGHVVPEPAFSRREYEERILGRIYRDLEPLDPEGVLRHEWVNARGAIARFGRGAIEIRLIDAQECPSADLAVVAAVVSVVRALAEGPLAARDLREDPDTGALSGLLDAVTRDGERAPVSDARLLRTLGMPHGPIPAGRVWAHLLEAFPPPDPLGEWGGALETILRHGPLARRILDAVGPAATRGHEPDRGRLREVYGALCDCLAQDRLFKAS